MNKEPVVARRSQKLKLGIVGHGFVGQAVDYGFTTPHVEKFIVDPKYGVSNTIDDLCDFNPNVVFICAPTPSKDDGSVDCSIVEESVMTLINKTDSFIIIKSTVPPDIVDSLMQIDQRIAYCPEFLTEGNSKSDFVNAQFRIIGISDESARNYIEGIFNGFSLCNPCNTIPMTGIEASFFKYAINTFLAMKLTFFNQLSDYMADFGGSYNTLTKTLPIDQRIGHTHMRIPGPDGKRGFGGACFPKDLDGFIHFIENNTEQDPKLLKTVKEINAVYRSAYDLDEREKANNIKYE